VVTDRMEDRQDDFVAVRCLRVCSGSAWLGDLLGVSRTVECDLLSLCLSYTRFFLSVSCTVSSFTRDVFLSGNCSFAFCVFVVLL